VHAHAAMRRGNTDIGRQVAVGDRRGGIVLLRSGGAHRSELAVDCRVGRGRSCERWHRCQAEGENRRNRHQLSSHVITILSARTPCAQVFRWNSAGSLRHRVTSRFRLSGGDWPAPDGSRVE
jgi:hypothetical protein